MKKITQLCVISMIAVLLLTACSSATPNTSSQGESPSAEAAQATASPSEPLALPSVSIDPAAEENKSRLIKISVDSASLKNNLTGASSKKSLSVYLPPSYYESDKAYPVVYYLHGHGETVGGFINANRVGLDKAFDAGANEFILVEIQGDKSFYVNSPVTGNWEDFIINEVIPVIDNTYRTIADKDSRGICGFSMGGFGSLNLALRHTDVFCAVYSMSPGLLKDEDFADAMVLWKHDGTFLNDYALAFSPDPEADKLGHIPVLDGSEEDNAVIEQWKTGFGNIEEKIDTYLAQTTQLKAIGLSYGDKDTYKWIPKGTQYFSDYLTEKGVEHTLFVFDGYHQIPPNGAEEHIIPFFEENLKF